MKLLLKTSGCITPKRIKNNQNHTDSRNKMIKWNLGGRVANHIGRNLGAAYKIDSSSSKEKDFIFVLFGEAGGKVFGRRW